jgi:uncharacterized protein GlcG (DUF336 family)
MQKISLIGAALALSLAAPAHADTCSQLAKSGLSYGNLKSTLTSVVGGRGAVFGGTGNPNGGLGFAMWLTLVDGSGKVCSVVNSLGQGEAVTSNIWLGSRVISAQKANTANAFSTPDLSLSTANLYAAVQPGGSLFGLQESNPVDATVAYSGSAADFGTPHDPLVGNRIGGINVFGGGLTLYGIDGSKIGAIGVSGDTSCTDHVVAYKVRAHFQDGTTLAKTVPGGLDKMIQDITVLPSGVSQSSGGFGHPICLNNPTQQQAGGAIQ